MKAFTAALLVLLTLSGCETLNECRNDLACHQTDKWDKYDNWGKPDPHANIEP